MCSERIRIRERFGLEGTLKDHLVRPQKRTNITSAQKPRWHFPGHRRPQRPALIREMSQPPPAPCHQKTFAIIPPSALVTTVRARAGSHEARTRHSPRHLNIFITTFPFDGKIQVSYGIRVPSSTGTVAFLNCPSSAEALLLPKVPGVRQQPKMHASSRRRALQVPPPATIPPSPGQQCRIYRWEMPGTQHCPPCCRDARMWSPRHKLQRKHPESLSSCTPPAPTDREAPAVPAAAPRALVVRVQLPNGFVFQKGKKGGLFGE